MRPDPIPPSTSPPSAVRTIGATHQWSYKRLGALTMTLRGCKIASRPNSALDPTAFGGEDHWCFAPMINLAFGEINQAIRHPAVGCKLRLHYCPSQSISLREMDCERRGDE